MDEDDRVSRELSHDECWELLRSHEFGRLAFRLVDEVHIAPINYIVDQDKLLFRTGEGSKLLAVAMSSSVAFEIDERDDLTARSVVVRGTARLLGEDEEHRIENAPLASWVGALADNTVEICPETVTGRLFARVPPRHAGSPPVPPASPPAPREGLEVDSRPGGAGSKDPAVGPRAGSR